MERHRRGAARIRHRIKTAASFCGLLVCVFLWTACTPTLYARQGFAMDTVISLRAYSPQTGRAYGPKADRAMDAALAELNALEASLSVTKDDSEVSAINQNAGSLTPVSPRTAQILDAALTVSRQSGGVFDPAVYPLVRAWGFTTGSYRVPDAAELAALLELGDYNKIRLEGQSAGIASGMAIDLGGIAKGYAGDALAEVYAAYGINSGVINLGGNVRVVGEKPGGIPWRVAIQDPFDAASNICIIEVRDANVITSGGYQRYFERDGKKYHHIIDPATGYPSDSGLASVTVVAAGGLGAEADATATALFIMGLEESLSYLSTWGGFEAVFVTGDGELVATSGVAAQIKDVARGYSLRIADGGE